MWIKKRTYYTCPMLMTIQGWLIKDSRWEREQNSNLWRLVRGNVTETCYFPLWLIRLEYRFWATRLGIIIRAKFEEEYRDYTLRSTSNE